MFNKLASYQKPWKDTISWESIEGEFKLSASCTSLGAIIFTITLKDLLGTSEALAIQVGLETEFGQLQQIAKRSDNFFNSSSFRGAL